jgi:hypothetical protein
MVERTPLSQPPPLSHADRCARCHSHSTWLAFPALDPTLQLGWVFYMYVSHPSLDALLVMTSCTKCGAWKVAD